MNQVEEANDGQAKKSTFLIGVVALALVGIVLLGYWVVKKNKNVLSLNTKLQKAEAAQTEYGDKDIRLKISLPQSWKVFSDSLLIDLNPISVPDKGKLTHSEVFLYRPGSSVIDPKIDKAEQSPDEMIIRFYGTDLKPYIGAGLSSSSSIKDVAELFHYGEIGSQKARDMKFLDGAPEVKIGVNGETALKESSEMNNSSNSTVSSDNTNSLAGRQAASYCYYLFNESFYYEIWIDIADKNDTDLNNQINSVLQSIQFTDIQTPEK